MTFPPSKLSVFSNSVHHLSLHSNNTSAWNLTNFNDGYFGIIKDGAAAPALTILNSGNVGIGTTSPSSLFHVVGGANQWATFQRGSKVMYVNANYSDNNLYSMVANRTTDNMGLSLTSKDSSPEYLFVAADGKVSVGMTSGMWQKFSVYGAATINGAAREVLGVYDMSPMAGGVGGGIVFGGRYTATGPLAQNFASIQARKDNGTDGDYAAAMTFSTRANGQQPTERMRIDSAGRVGIGNPSPAHPLDVTGSLRVQAAVDANDYPAMLDMTASGPGGQRNRWMTFVGSATGAIGVPANSYELYEYPAGALPVFAAVRMSIRKSNTPNGTPPKTFLIDGAGRVGIGTIGPSEALEVVGNILASGDIRANGVIHAKYQDVAEWVPAKQDLVPGTVVVLNPERDNEVMASTLPYDTAVAGVVSEQPGLILGEAGESKEQIATTGRVRVRVDAGRAPIAIGDLLVTSDRPGYAMKSIPVAVAGISMHRPGTVVGKALQALPSGEGEILVLLSLQ
jgi:hypothetical protein